VFCTKLKLPRHRSYFLGEPNSHLAHEKSLSQIIFQNQTNQDFTFHKEKEKRIITYHQIIYSNKV
jgi:hypothetical protein